MLMVMVMLMGSSARAEANVDGIRSSWPSSTA
jgi:hypothetical protein